MMITKQCPHCGSNIQMEENQPVRFCPFCGKTLEAEAQQGPSALEKRLTGEKNPKKKYRIIQDALATSPDDFEANKALLFHGRLHEPLARGKGLDFSIIKSHLLSVFGTPQAYDEAERAAKLEELLRGEQLRRTMALAPDADAFYAEYMYRMAQEYIDLFIRGDSKNNSLAFGFNRTPDSTARKCAPQVAAMLQEIGGAQDVTDAERALLIAAVREGYNRVFPGYMKYLDA